MDNFWLGFVKHGYDYAHETRQMGQRASQRSQIPPKSWGAHTAPTAGAGAAAGGFLGAMGSPGKFKTRAGGAGKGALLGMGLGALLGALGKVIDEADYAESKKIMSMPPEEREEYLRSKARRAEKGEQEMSQEMRHREMMQEMKRQNPNMGM